MSFVMAPPLIVLAPPSILRAKQHTQS